MLRRFVIPVLAAIALAGVLLLPSPAVAHGRPSFLLCQVDDEKGNSAVYQLYIKWEAAGMQGAVDACLAMGGHPIGVDDDGKDPIEEPK